MLEKPGRARGFDPRTRKAKDNARQRKIATNNSDKASRKNAPKIKASANRRIRRADKALLDAEYDLNADALRTDHQHKLRHWGTDNAAERRTRQAKRQAQMREAGGRTSVQLQALEALPNADHWVIKDQIARLRRAIAQKRASKTTGALVAVLLLTAAEAPAETPIAPDLDLFCNRTIHFYEPAHGNQIEFFEPTGLSYLWYPGLTEIVPGEWIVERLDGEPEYQICFRYPERFYNPVTFENGGEWRCRTYSNFTESLVETGVRDGDPFALSTGEVPFDLPAHPIADLDALEAALPAGLTPPPASPAACSDLLS